MLTSVQRVPPSDPTQKFPVVEPMARRRTMAAYVAKVKDMLARRVIHVFSPV